MDNEKLVVDLPIPNENSGRGTYVVCKNGDCAQTYDVKDVVLALDTLPEEEKHLIVCPKCRRGRLLDNDLKATLSANPDVIHFVTSEDYDKLLKDRKMKLKEEKEELMRKLAYIELELKEEV